MTDLYELPGHLIRRLHQISVSVFAARMARAGHGLTPVQFAALLTIGEQPGIDQATLAALIAYDKVTIGGVVDRLTRKGLVSRTRSERDRRARALDLTEGGRALLKAVRPVVEEIQDEMLIGLTPAERARLIELLRKATAAGNALSRAPLKIDAGAR